MDPITLGLLVGGGLGLGKGVLDMGTEKRDRAAAAETMRWAPWTHLTPGAIKKADVLGSTMQGGLAGGMFGAANSDAIKAAMASPIEATPFDPSAVPSATAEPYSYPNIPPTSESTNALMGQAANGGAPWNQMGGPVPGAAVSPYTGNQMSPYMQALLAGR